MLKEIHEQPRSIADTCADAFDSAKAPSAWPASTTTKPCGPVPDRLIIVACGTSWHAGLIAEYMFEEFARIPVEVEYASEFRYRNPVIEENDILIAISQSGETADTLAAIRMAKEQGAHVFGICNVVGSSIAQGVPQRRLHPCRPGNRRGQYQGVYGPIHRSGPRGDARGPASEHARPPSGQPA